ncbi:MAG: lysophospholipase [Planctomycetota bacterium]|nr:MAG: lysophospholipase [Planctomycetota bacterium]
MCPAISLGFDGIGDIIWAMSTTRCILFQGDSITDAKRSRQDGNDVHGLHLGCGYAMLIAAQLGREGDLSCFRNLGISGNRITDLYARIKEHGWNHQPQLLSILIGVNDTWHEFMRSAGVDIARFARVYSMLLNDTRQRLPACQLVLCDPFVLPCGVVEDEWRADIDQRRRVVRELAHETGAIHVPLQDAFDHALGIAAAEHWAADGVHPTPAGHALIAETWLAAVRKAGWL